MADPDDKTKGTGPQPAPAQPTPTQPAPAPPTPAVPTLCSDDVAVDDQALLYPGTIMVKVTVKVTEKVAGKDVVKNVDKDVAKDVMPLPVSASTLKDRKKLAKKLADAGKKFTDDYKAVWAFTPQKPDPGLLVFFHGNSHYVTVDKLSAPRKKYGGSNGPSPPSRIPEWAESDKGLRFLDQQGGHENAAAGLFYELNDLDTSQKGLPKDSGTEKKPVVLVPEDVELWGPKVAWWAGPPWNQYTEPDRLWNVVSKCYEHLRCLPRDPKGVGPPYLPPTKDKSGSSYPENLNRLYLCGHSGGGKPMYECAAADWVMTNNVPGGRKVPIDFWLFDATYWSKIDKYVALCQRWRDDKTLGNGASNNRFVCIFGHTKYTKLEWLDKKETIPALDSKGVQKSHSEGTEAVAEDMRDKFFNLLKDAIWLKNKPVKSKDLWVDHRFKKTADNMDAIITALKDNPVLFIRTEHEHEDIPTKFTPVLLRTAAS